MISKLSSWLIIFCNQLNVESVICKTIWRCYAFFFEIRQLEYRAFYWISFILFEKILIVNSFLWIGRIQNKLTWMADYDLMLTIMFFVCELSNLNHFLLFIMNFQKLLSSLILNSNRVIVIKIIQKLNSLSLKLKLRISCTAHVRDQTNFSDILL